MAEQPVNSGLKTALELGPVAAFFIGYIYLKDRSIEVSGTEYSGFIIVTALFVPLLLASTAILWRLTGKLSKMQLMTAVLVIFFGGMTIWFNDERFFKMKTTLVYGSFALILGVGLAMGRSWLPYVLSDALPMAQEGWMILTKRLTLAFAVLAVGNEIVWRTMSTDAWVKIETFGFPIALFVFLWLQFAQLQKYMDLDDSK